MACRARCLVRVSTHLLSDRAKKVTLMRQVLSKAALFRGDHVIAQGDSSRAATHLKVRDLFVQKSCTLEGRVGLFSEAV